MKLFQADPRLFQTSLIPWILPPLCIPFAPLLDAFAGIESVFGCVIYTGLCEAFCFVKTCLAKRNPANSISPASLLFVITWLLRQQSNTHPSTSSLPRFRALQWNGAATAPARANASLEFPTFGGKRFAKRLLCRGGFDVPGMWPWMTTALFTWNKMCWRTSCCHICEMAKSHNCNILQQNE